MDATTDSAHSNILEVDCLVVGAGPAGASLACFLGKHGLKGLIVSSAPSTANTPRAHIINQPAMECLRDLDPDMEKELLKLGYSGSEKGLTRWCSTMSGREFGRMPSWGAGPKRAGDFEQSSPCSHLELPQTLVEPILLRYATQHGFTARFSMQLLQFDDSCSGAIIVELQDRTFGQKQKVQCKYLFGADGAKSQIAKQLDLRLANKASQGIALNVLVRADLSTFMGPRVGNLHYVIRPDEEMPEFAAWSIVRMVKPWYEWLIIMMFKPSCDPNLMPEKEEIARHVKAVIADDSIPVDVLRVDKWSINETVAESYSKGRVFCLGDAVHRHPPMNGLGSNTCIQDAANLAWKVALVEKGMAGNALLDTYSVERQPVGAQVVERANSSLRNHFPIFEALGFLNPSLEERKKEFALLDEVSKRGTARRRKLADAIDATAYEFLAQGSDMGQRYASTAVFHQDSGDPPPEPVDPVLYHVPHTFPGHRLPHAWLNSSVPGEPVSTLDVAGNGRFALFIGHGGDAWRGAADIVEKDFGVQIAVIAVGFGLQYEAVFNDWYRLREVEEDGCVLARPDNFVVWRCQRLDEKPETMLRTVFRHILAL